MRGLFTRIIATSFFVMMLLSLGLSFFGIHHVDFGNDWWLFMKTRIIIFDNAGIKFEIPNIPYIQQLEVVDGMTALLSFLIYIGNFFIQIGNFIVVTINLILELVEFLSIFFMFLGQPFGDAQPIFPFA